MMRASRTRVFISLLFLVTGVTTVTASAQQPAAVKDKIRVGKAIAEHFAFIPMEVGVELGIWEKVGLEVEIAAFGGDARMQQALIAASIDFGLGSGPGLGFLAKGVPAKGVAAFAGPPRNMAMLVHPDGPIKDVKALRGKKIGVTTPGSLTDWLVRELSRQQGWGAEGITRVPVGGSAEMRAAFRTKQLDGFVHGNALALDLEDKGEVRVLINFGDYVKDFHTHIIFARNEVIQKNPNVVRKFVRGWFDTVAYMKANRAQTINMAVKTLKMSERVAGKVYDSEIPMMSSDGAFDPAAVEVLRKSFVELGILSQEPDPRVLFTTEFVPVKR
jgi:ABC-type nitrate/sulfonate/bicarbonate transport system substrate-binding protein